jgi:hypothetical protein
MRQSKNKKNAKSKADKYFSKYIRLRDSDSNGLSKCITCGTFKSWKEMDCGHFISRRFESVRYDEQNAHAQCKKCNRFENGNQFEHGMKLDKKYGEGTAESLLQKSKMICRRKKSDYEWIAKEYKQKIEQL